MLKRFAKIVIASVYFLAIRVAQAAGWILGRNWGDSFAIVYYHGIPDEARGRFVRQMDILIRTCVPVSLTVPAPHLRNRRCVAVTFDDAFESVFRNAVPELVQRGIPATVFAPSGALGCRPSWVPEEGHESSMERVIDANGLREQRSQTLTIGSHTVTHVRLTGLSDEKALEEMGKSKKDLEELLGTEVPFLAFPHGAYDERIEDIARRVGYRKVFSILPNFSSDPGERFVWGRIDVSPNDWEVEFRLKILDAYRWMGPLSALKAAVRRFVGKR